MRHGLTVWLMLTFGTLMAATHALSQEGSNAESDEVCYEDVDTCVTLMRGRFAERGAVGFGIYPPEGKRTDDGDLFWDVRIVVPGSAAEESGLRNEDRIVALDGEKLPPGSPEPVFRRFKVDQKIKITVLRDGKKQDLVATARKPSPEYIEAWLMSYVHDNFDEDTFYEYQLREQAQ